MLRASAAVATLTILSAGMAPAQTKPTYTESYRPQFHFTPAVNWMNDPNGLVHYDGEYHLFYQYNPFGDRWGHMSWGHAVSPDLVHWEHLPVAIPEAGGVMAFSGSVVIDWKNTSGLGIGGEPPMVAIYTGAREGNQSQYLAYSTDRGRTWTQYAGNPVLDIGSAEFRDPKVIWYEPEQKWVMPVVLATEHKVSFYSSSDLKRWTHLSDFGPAAAVGGVWEVPDLFELPVDGDPNNTRWVLQVDLNPGGPVGGSGAMYFIGHFDGTRFTVEANGVDPVASVPQGRLLGDFEGRNYGGWTATGIAFGRAPATGKLGSQQTVHGFHGKGVANSFHGGDAATGTLLSPTFDIDRDYLNFLIGGGRNDATRLELLVDGTAVRTARGENSVALDWKSWDVRELKGKNARLRIVDEHTGGWGHILVDHLVLSDQPALSGHERARWVDHGSDFYAAISWSDVPEIDGRRIWLGWMSNWLYAGDAPTSPWRSAQSIPRTVGLRTLGGRVQLVQQPVVELQRLRTRQHHLGRMDVPDGTTLLSDRGIAGKALEIVAEFEPGTATEFGLKVRVGAGEETVIGVDPQAGKVFVDRTRSGKVDFHPAFAARHAGPLEIVDGRVRLHLFVDWSSVELFAGEGQTVITELIFPLPESDGVALYSRGGTAQLVSLDLWELRSAWNTASRSR